MATSLLKSQATPADDTTMVIYRGGRKPLQPERKRELAKRCGVNFIRLIYKYDISTNVGVSGFQHVKLKSMPRKGGGAEPAAQWHQNIYTHEPMAEGSMDFVPDEMHTGIAYLPDSPFNRVRLAYAEIAKNALWKIDDDSIRREILELANKIQESIEFRQEEERAKQKRIEVDMRVKEKNVAVGIEHKTRLEIEVGVLEDQVKELELVNKREALKKRLSDLQGYHPELVSPLSTSPVLQPTPKGSFDEDAATSDTQEETDDNLDDIVTDEEQSDIEQEDRAMLRSRAKTEIHNENQELIETIKGKYLKRTGRNRGWAFSPEYREKIGPLVKARMEKLQNEYATVGVAD